MEALLSHHDLIPDRALTADDTDAFNHQAIAGRVAELVFAATTPANVAIFGAWGSGKSSLYELLRRSLGSGPRKAALVRYDAWKYGGASLKRNFITHAATELGLGEEDVRNHAFHRGLYESTRTLDLQFGQFLKNQTGHLLKLAGTTIVLVVLVIAGAAAGVATIIGADVLETIARWLPPLGLTAATGLASLVAALKLLDIARVELEQTAPSADEQFSRTFDKLITAARERGPNRGFDRVVFFVDELDRCSKSDVLETLNALRTFLDVPRCVFVVVADRDVLEEALTALTQSTPSNAEDPYYSSASAYLDKIFQYQINLPPLRLSRLTRFARDLVSERGGLWKELRGGDRRDLLNAVVYALIPSHVRSPRRVKVLLNRFAANVRVAQARGIDWQARAGEVAKLSVLQAEFPAFADALHTEPKLPLYVRTRTVPATAPLRSAGVIRRFVRPPLEAPSETTQPSEELSEPLRHAPLDPLLSSAGDRFDAYATQHRNLHRYLERTSGIPDPGNDLLYLEVAGTAVGLDGEVGQLIEDMAPDIPAKAIAYALTLPAEQQVGALRLLADMVEREFGVERANVMNAMLSIAVEAQGLDRAVASALARAITSFRQEQELGEEHLAVACSIALEAEASELLSSLFDETPLIRDAARLVVVARHLPRLPGPRRLDVIRMIEELLPVDEDVLLIPLRDLEEHAATQVLEGLSDAVVMYLGPDSPGTNEEAQFSFLERLVAGNASEPSVADLLWNLLQAESKACYQLLKGTPALLQGMSDQVRNSFVLKAVTQGGTEDWAFWSGMIAPQDNDWDEQGRRALEVVEEVFAAAVQGLTSETSAVALVQRVAPISAAVDAESASTVGKLVGDALRAREWWKTEKGYGRQAFLHQLAGELGKAGVKTAAAVVAQREEDLARAIGGPNQPATELALRGVRAFGADLPPHSQERLLQVLDESAAAVGTPLESAFARTKIAVAVRCQHKLDETDGSYPPSFVAAALGDYSDEGLAALRGWVSLGPGFDEVVDVAKAVPAKFVRSVIPVFGLWGSAVEEPDRTRFLERIWANGVAVTAWTRGWRGLGVDELALVDRAFEEVRTADRLPERRGVIEKLRALAPQNARAQHRVADMIMWLLGRGRKGDLKLAFFALPALGTGHRSRSRLESEFRKVVSKLGVQIKPRQLQLLLAAGLALPKRSLTERAVALLDRLR